MFVVIFEVQPRKERWDDYLNLAKGLKPKLEAIDGFIDNERYASRGSERRLLSLSTWRDEKAVIRWRTHEAHHEAQQKGRFEIFEDYHLRVGEVTSDSAPPPGLALVEHRFDETAKERAKAASITEVMPRGDGLAAERLAALLGLGPGNGASGHEVFASIYNPGKLVLLVTWRDAAAAAAWTAAAPTGIGALRHRRVRVIRDYGMTDRDEAPQYYPEVRPARGRPVRQRSI